MTDNILIEEIEEVFSSSNGQRISLNLFKKTLALA